MLNLLGESISSAEEIRMNKDNVQTIKRTIFIFLKNYIYANKNLISYKN